jgi:hypothetical protein
MMKSNLRQCSRYSAMAHALVSELIPAEAVLRDLSVTGCRLEFSAAVACGLGKLYRVTIIPEARASIETFDLDAEVRWSRSEYDAFEVGFSIVISPKGKAFLRYVDYLAYRASEGNPIQISANGIT